MQTCELAGDRTGDPGISSDFDSLGLKLVDRKLEKQRHLSVYYKRFLRELSSTGQVRLFSYRDTCL